MEGLKVKIVELQKVEGNKEIRLESDFWIKEKAQFKSVKGADVEAFCQYGTSKELNEDGKGYPVLRLNEFDSFFIHEPAKYCDIIDEETYNSLKLKKDDVLICRTNGNPRYVGKAALVPQDYEYAFASYLYRIRPQLDIINSATLVAYLNSKYGRSEIERLSLVGNQANFSPAKFRQIEIPILDKKLQQIISESINIAYLKLQEAKDIYLRAENILLDELGLASWQPSHAQIAIRTLQEAKVSDRIDAEYYQPKYDELFSQLDQFPTKKLGEIVVIQKSIEPGSNKYLAKGIPFVRVAELTEFGIISPSVFLDNDLFEDVIRPQKNTILLSKDGSIGIAYKVVKDEDFITSSAILHLQIIDENILPDYLSLIINSVVVRMQAEQNSSGAIIQHWKPSEIRDVIIPILPMEKQIAISQEVINSFKLRSESKTIIEASKFAIEKAIEQDMQSAISYMEDIRSSIVSVPITDITKPIIEGDNMSDNNNDEEESKIIVLPEYREGCVPLYTLRAACGAFTGEGLWEKEGWVDVSGNGFTPNPKRYFAVYAKGNSMYPDIKDGDICVFEWYNQLGGTREDDIVLAECEGIDDECTIKKYHSVKKYYNDGSWEHEKIELIPLNNEYDTIVLEAGSKYRTIGILKCVL